MTKFRQEIAQCKTVAYTAFYYSRLLQRLCHPAGIFSTALGTERSLRDDKVYMAYVVITKLMCFCFTRLHRLIMPGFVTPQGSLAKLWVLNIPVPIFRNAVPGA